MKNKKFMWIIIGCAVVIGIVAAVIYGMGAGKGKEEGEDGGGIGDADGEGGKKQPQTVGIFRLPAGGILFPAQQTEP